MPQLWGPNGLVTSAAKFACAAEERIDMVVEPTAPPGKWLPVALKPVDPATARPLLANMAMVLLPHPLATPAP